MAAPLIAQSGLIGVLSLFNKEELLGFSTDDKRFLGIVATQTATVIQNAQLFDKQLELHALEEEMKRARSIQEAYLPQGEFKTEHYEIHGFNQPAKDVGGDYFDVFPLSDEEIILSIGDVAGKGIPAALMASEAQAVIRSLLTCNPKMPLQDLMESLNRLFVTMTKPDQYITAVIASYNLRTRIFKSVNAGHLLPLVVTEAGVTEIVEGGGPIVGVLQEARYELSAFQLEPGNELFLFTDGITENFGPGSEEFGDLRIKGFLEKRFGSNLKTIQEDLLDELIEFRKGLPQSDDITCLHLRAK